MASASFYQKIVDAKTEDALNAVLDEIKAYVDGADVKAVLDMPGMEEAPETDAPAEDGGEDTPVEEEKDYTSVAAYYDEWLTAKALKVVEAE